MALAIKFADVALVVAKAAPLTDEDALTSGMLTFSLNLARTLTLRRNLPHPRHLRPRPRLRHILRLRQRLDRLRQKR